MTVKEKHVLEDDHLQEQIRLLFRREMLYISSTASKVYQAPLQHIRYRHKILVWVHKIVTHFQLNMEVAPITMDFIDRFHLLDQTTERTSSRSYQLVAMTSLYLAMKLNVGEANFIDHQGDIQPKNTVCLREFSELSRGQFTPDDIIWMERSLLSTLSWKVNPVSTNCFVHSLLKLMRPAEENDKVLTLTVGRKILSELAQYFAEVASFLPENSQYCNLDCSQRGSLHHETFAPSTVAYASIILGMEAISHSALPLDIRNEFLRKCTLCSTQSYLKLHPDRNDIKELQLRIKKSFSPGILLNEIVANSEGVYDIDLQEEILSFAFFERTNLPEGDIMKDSSELLKSPTSSMDDFGHHSNPHVSSPSPSKRIKSLLS